jgi:hypothetical protein
MAVLLALLTVVQGQKLSVSFSEESQELEPKGSIVGIDSVVVDAKFAELSIPISLTIERINNPEVLVPAIATTETTPISPFYQIRSRWRQAIYPGQLTVSIPHPEGAPTENLAVAFLSNDNVEDVAANEPQWSFAPATYAPATDEIVFGLKYAAPEGMPFVIVSGRYYVPQ